MTAPANRTQKLNPIEGALGDPAPIRFTPESFGKTFAGFFALLWILGLIRGTDAAWTFFDWSVATAFVTWATPSVLIPFAWAWARLAELLARFVQPLVLGGLFFLFITPVGLLWRMRQKNPLHLKPESDLDTYWLTRSPPGPDARTLPRQF